MSENVPIQFKLQEEKIRLKEDIENLIRGRVTDIGPSVSYFDVISILDCLKMEFFIESRGNDLLDNTDYSI